MYSCHINSPKLFLGAWNSVNSFSKKLVYLPPVIFSISILHHFATISCIYFKLAPSDFLGFFFPIELSLAFVFNWHRRCHSKAARRHVLDVSLRSLETSFGHSNVSNLNAVTFAFKWTLVNINCITRKAEAWSNSRY